MSRKGSKQTEIEKGRISAANKVEQIRVSVRNLVEFILRSGDIDNRRGTMADKDAMQMGSRLHRKIQGRMGADYHAEVPLKTEIDYETFLLVVEGRADGIFKEQEKYVIDEIKGVFRDVERMEEADPIHLAQAKCYACIYAGQRNLEEIGVQMTYANLDTEEIRRFHYTYTKAELESWFEELTAAYRKWAQMQLEWKYARKDSIGKTVFPYPYREGQKDLAAAVYRTIWHGKKLFIQAPTGVGKTLSTVFPAVQAVGQDLGDKIFYLTAKTITRTVAEEAFTLLKKQGLHYKVLTLTAKEKICFCEEPDCNPEKCPYAKGHFDRVNDAVFELLTEYEENPGNYNRDRIMEQAQKWQVCPFEMALDVSLWSDAIICDYNYVFDPQAKLKRFFSDGVKGDYLFLIDEAHNLVERGREMYSATLYKEDFLDVKRFLKPYSRKAVAALERGNKYLLEWKRECEEYTLLSNIDTFALNLFNVSHALEQILEDRESIMNRPSGDGETEEAKKKTLDFYFQVRAFLDIYEEIDDSYEIYVQHDRDGRFALRLYCIHTADKLGQCLEKGRAAILFSATLLPVQYYMELLSGEKDDYAVYAKSTFDPARKKILLGLDVSTKYTRRTTAEFRKIASYIQQVTEAKAGNYLVFFPSYKMMTDVRECFDELKNSETEVIEQSTHMTEAQREEFLDQFQERENGALVGFCVMGGIFGEGIDLKKNRLIGAIVVGPGLPQVCNEREILKQYYDRRNMDGFDHAYRYPGMNKVMQSAGRVIRTDEDTGVIVLLDERFGQQQYRSSFPREWADYETCTLNNVKEKLTAFWNLDFN